MRVHRVFVRPLQSGEVRLSGAEAQHLQVLRVKPGTAVRAFDGFGLEAEGIVTAADDTSITVDLGPPRTGEVEAPAAVTLAVALLKGDKMSDVVRMGTELGVTRFIPFASVRADVRTLSRNKLERWRRVAKEAGKQSGRSLVPEVTDLLGLGELTPGTLGLVAHPGAARSLRDLLPEAPPSGSSLTLVSGPEGGLTDTEIAALVERGFKPVRLGARILRAETAPVALASAVLVPEAL